MGVTIYMSRLILQVMGAIDYGIYGVVGGVVSIMGVLNSALSASTSRFLTYELGKGDEYQLRNTFSASLNLHIGVALLVLFIAETIGLWFFYNKLIIPEDRMQAAFWVYQFSIMSTMVTFTQVPYNATLIAHENMSVYAYVGLYEAFSKLGIVYLLYISPIDRLVLYSGLLMVNSIGMQMFYRCYTSKKYYECKFRFVKDKFLYKRLLGYSGWDLFGNLAVACQGQGINILLNMFFGPLVNAARTISFQIQSAVAMFLSNFILAVRPQIVKSYAENNKDRMFSLTFATAKFSYMLMLALVTPLCFEMDFILKIWLGENVPPNTNVFAVIILITYLMETYHSSALMPYHAIGKIKLGNIVGGTLMIMALPVSYMLLNMGLPAYSVYISIFVINLFSMAWGWWIVHHYVAFSYYELIKKVYVPTILVTVITVLSPLAILYLMEEGWLRLTLLVLVTETVFLLVVYSIGLKRRERSKLNEIIKQRISK